MNTLAQMRSAIQSDINVSANSSQFPPATIDAKLNRAYIKVAGFVRWPDLEDAKETSTQANQDYYDVPDTWRYDSSWRVTVDGDLYGEKPEGNPLEFSDFLKWKIDNPGSTLKKWSKYRNQIFLYPTPTTIVTIVAWGVRNVTELTSDSDTTIFSSNLPEINEAIVLETTAMLQRKGEAEDKGEFVSSEAKQIVLLTFNRIKAEQAKFEKIQPMWNVPDMYGRSNSEDVIGNFVDTE